MLEPEGPEAEECTDHTTPKPNKEKCKVGIRRGRNGATEYARRRENAEMRKVRESGNAEGAETRKDSG